MEPSRFPEYVDRMSKADSILKEALTLPEDERTTVVLGLLDSLDPPDPLGHLDEGEWLAEIDRRAKRAISGESRGTAWETVRARIESKLKP